MDLELQDKVAIVTGASRGLGLAMVEAYVAEGMRVVAAARTADALDALAKRFPGSVHASPCDMTNTEEVAALVDVAFDVYGALDVIVNNAGIAPAARFGEMEVDQWREVFEVNVFAPVALTQAAGRRFLEQGYGKVINIASLSGLRGKPTLAAYSASKGALLRFTEAVSGEWASKGIQVNAIAPGAFATAAQDAVLNNPEILTRRLRKIPAGRMGAIEEIGPLACFLASPKADFITGAVYVIDGGEVSKL